VSSYIRLGVASVAADYRLCRGHDLYEVKDTNFKTLRDYTVFVEAPGLPANYRSYGGHYLY
jgi:hypothetical protein